jgi:hypothetical protein
MFVPVPFCIPLRFNAQKLRGLKCKNGAKKHRNAGPQIKNILLCRPVHFPRHPTLESEKRNTPI